ncbi:MAG: HEAT repeat domain-containing protein [Phycisphaerae bacterium]|nr:HEAT repeat domain-containing protein [Phycisphaerae bacterium]
MQAKGRQVLVEEIEYSFEQGRISSNMMQMGTQQGESKRFVGKKKANTLADLHAALEFLASCAKKVRIRRTPDGKLDAVGAGFSDWEAYVEWFVSGNTLLGSCKQIPKAGTKAPRDAKKKGSLKVGGIPMGPGATLDELLRLGVGWLAFNGDSFKVVLVGPGVIFGKKKLKISHLEYTFPRRGIPQMLAVVEAGKENSASDLKAFYEYIKGQAKRPRERTSPGKRETLAEFGPKKWTVTRCLLSTHKNSNGDQVATRLEIMYPGKWTLDPPASDIEHRANSGQWKRADGRWVFMNTRWIFTDGKWIEVQSAVDSTFIEGLNQIEGIPTATGKKLPTTVDLLIKVLASKNWMIRLQAIVTLGKGGPEVSRAAIPAMKKALKDSDPYVRKAAAAAIKNIMQKTSPKATTRPE